VTIQSSASVLNEGSVLSFWVNRDFYSQGAISVTVRVAAGSTATPGQDFSNSGSSGWQDVVLTWGDGELGSKYLTVPVARDDIIESTESFTLELVSPTGGAMLGSKSQLTVTVFDLPPPRSNVSSGGGGGGGTFGWLGAMLLGLGGALRRRRIRNR
jgi:MYXO-CTERM domain-containing protein